MYMPNHFSHKNKGFTITRSCVCVCLINYAIPNLDPCYTKDYAPYVINTYKALSFISAMGGSFNQEVKIGLWNCPWQ